MRTNQTERTWYAHACSFMDMKRAVFGAERFIYTHPDDADPTVGLSMPRPERQLVGHGEGTVTDFANRDRPLADVLDQIATFDGSPDGIIANHTWPIPGYSPPQFASRMI